MYGHRPHAGLVPETLTTQHLSINALVASPNLYSGASTGVRTQADAPPLLLLRSCHAIASSVMQPQGIQAVHMHSQLCPQQVAFTSRC